MGKETKIKIVMLGTSSVGKSAISNMFVNNEFLNHYDPTVEEFFEKKLLLDGNEVMVEILDTAGTEQFTSLLDLYIKNGMAFVLVYSITSEESFKSLKKIRDNILNIKGENVPIIIAGNKTDLTESRIIEKSSGENLAESWGANFIECSAMYNYNIEELFNTLLNDFKYSNGTISRVKPNQKVKTKTEKKLKCHLL